MAQKRSRDSPGSTKPITTPIDRGATVPGEKQAEGGEPPIITASDDEAPPPKRGRREKFNNGRESVSEDGGDAVGDGELGGEEERSSGDTNGTSPGDTAGAAAATLGSSPQTGNSKRPSKRSSVTRRAEETGANDEEEVRFWALSCQKIQQSTATGCSRRNVRWQLGFVHGVI